MSNLIIDQAEVNSFIQNLESLPENFMELTGQLRNPKQAEASELMQIVQLLTQYDEAAKVSGVGKWFAPGTLFGIENLHKHRAFFDAGSSHAERLFMAANRVGKTISGAYEATCHATGEYPDWWTGKKFDHPTFGWAMGSTARATRDTVQKELLGRVGAWGTGMIPADKIGKWWALSGVPQGVDIVQVRHKSGGWSAIGFKNYEQPIEAFYGTDQHWVWADEICPINIYNECLVRLMTTKGVIYVTFTPLKGITPLVAKFCETADYLAGAKQIIGLRPLDDEKEDFEDNEGIVGSNFKAIVQAGWDDAPWLGEEEKTRILESSEPHLRETRRSGVPSMGSGNVYPMSLETMVCPPFEIPSHYKRLFALDVGWNRTACLWLAQDPSSGMVYVYDEHYMAEQPPAVHAASIRSRGQWIPGVIDPASRGRTQTDGMQLYQQYKELGLKLWPAKNAVESGIQTVWERMTGGRIKFFSTLQYLPREFVLYRRDERGRIIKENDHLMDALRYGVADLNRARSLSEMAAAPRYTGAAKYNIY